jgi:hypothetical protein
MPRSNDAERRARVVIIGTTPHAPRVTTGVRVYRTVSDRHRCGTGIRALAYFGAVLTLVLGAALGMIVFAPLFTDGDPWEFMDPMYVLVVVLCVLEIATAHLLVRVGRGERSRLDPREITLLAVGVGTLAVFMIMIIVPS